jgi:hypothetical protein
MIYLNQTVFYLLSPIPNKPWRVTNFCSLHNIEIDKKMQVNGFKVNLKKSSKKYSFTQSTKLDGSRLFLTHGRKHFILLLTLVCFILSFSNSIIAVELIYRKWDGSFLFGCGTMAYRGKVRVIPLRDNRYRIFGPAFVGESTAKSSIHAARKACGEDRTKPKLKPKPKNEQIDG